MRFLINKKKKVVDELQQTGNQPESVAINMANKLEALLTGDCPETEPEPEQSDDINTDTLSEDLSMLIADINGEISKAKEHVEMNTAHRAAVK